MAVSIESRIRAIEALIKVLDSGSKPKGSSIELLRSHARDAISALVWMDQDPECRALMKAQAERRRANG